MTIRSMHVEIPETETHVAITITRVSSSEGVTIRVPAPYRTEDGTMVSGTRAVTMSWRDLRAAATCDDLASREIYGAILAAADAVMATRTDHERANDVRAGLRAEAGRLEMAGRHVEAAEARRSADDIRG